MKFSVSEAPIDAVAARRSVADNSCGALVVFEGWIRDHNEGQAVERLEYEVYRPLAEKEGSVIINEAIEIARRFGTERSPSFVNGILDAIARSAGAGQGHG